MKFQDIKDMDKDDYLGILGLQTKRSFTNQLLGTLGTFGIGLLVGAGVALLLAPKVGRDLRHDLRAKLHRNGKGADVTGTEATDAGETASQQA
jgi:gas vesicle protein